MAGIDPKERESTARAAGNDDARGVGARRRGNSGRQTNKVKGNSGTFIGTEVHGDWEYARYEAIENTWVSASLAERGYDQQYGPSTAFGAYLGLAVDSNLEPLKNPDRIEPRQEYLIPIRKVRSPAPPPQLPVSSPPPTPLITPKSNQTAPPFVENRAKRAGKDVLVLLRGMTYPSFELEGDPPPPDREPRAAVSYWLGNHRKEILEGERRFRVSRVAIAGVIAWEALENPQVGSFKAVGVGKLHLEADAGDITWVEAVENAGKLPRLTLDERREFLKNPRLSILYIAATLELICEEAEKHGLNLRDSPDIIGHIYHSRSPKKWAGEIKAKGVTDPFALQPGGMGAWIGNNRKYLESAVGESLIP